MIATASAVFYLTILYPSQNPPPLGEHATTMLFTLEARLRVSGVIG